LQNKSSPPLILYFSSHEPEAISERFTQLLKNTDILVVENANWDESDSEGVELYNMLASGNIFPEDLKAMSPPHPFEQFESELRRVIFRSGKKIEFERSSLTFLESKRFMQCLMRPTGNSVSEATAKLRANLKEAGALMRKRDLTYADFLSEVVKINLRKKILAMAGEGHYRCLTKFISDKDVRFHAELHESARLATFTSEALSKCESGETLTQLEVLRSLTEFTLPPPTNLTLEEVRSRKSQIERLSEEELVRFMNRIYRQ
jgi:hypothetical protein